MSSWKNARDAEQKSLELEQQGRKPTLAWPMSKKDEK
jgi:hypothetical protein